MAAPARSAGLDQLEPNSTARRGVVAVLCQVTVVCHVMLETGVPWPGPSAMVRRAVGGR